ncbi:UNVERIFIED_CONTAM: hypothetical protein K2H54_075001 [Gekko kuhli]
MQDYANHSPEELPARRETGEVKAQPAGSPDLPQKGSLHRTSSVPEYVYNLDTVETDFASRPAVRTSYYQSHQKSSPVSYENGWGPRSVQYSSYKSIDERSQRQPLKRLEVSPDVPDKLAYLQNGLQYNRGLTLRPGDIRRSGIVPPRYARSEAGGYGSHSLLNRGSTFQRHFYVGPVNDTVVDSVPTSPGVPLYQQIRSSRSMTNLLDKDSYQNADAAMGQVRSPMASQAGSQYRQSMRSSWHQSTYRTQNTREASQPASVTSATAETGGRRMAMTAAMAAAAGSGFVEQERVASGKSQLG